MRAPPGDTSSMSAAQVRSRACADSETRSMAERAACTRARRSTCLFLLSTGHAPLLAGSLRVTVPPERPGRSPFVEAGIAANLRGANPAAPSGYGIAAGAWPPPSWVATPFARGTERSREVRVLEAIEMAATFSDAGPGRAAAAQAPVPSPLRCTDRPRSRLSTRRHAVYATLASVPFSPFHVPGASRAANSALGRVCPRSPDRQHAHSAR